MDDMQSSTASIIMIIIIILLIVGIIILIVVAVNSSSSTNDPPSDNTNPNSGSGNNRSPPSNGAGQGGNGYPVGPQGVPTAPKAPIKVQPQNYIIPPNTYVPSHGNEPSGIHEISESIGSDGVLNSETVYSYNGHTPSRSGSRRSRRRHRRSRSHRSHRSGSICSKCNQIMSLEHHHSKGSDFTETPIEHTTEDFDSSVDINPHQFEAGTSITHGENSVPHVLSEMLNSDNDESLPKYHKHDNDLHKKFGNINLGKNRDIKPTIPNMPRPTITPFNQAAHQNYTPPSEISGISIDESDITGKSDLGSYSSDFSNLTDGKYETPKKNKKSKNNVRMGPL